MAFALFASPQHLMEFCIALQLEIVFAGLRLIIHFYTLMKKARPKRMNNQEKGANVTDLKADQRRGQETDLKAGQRRGQETDLKAGQRKDQKTDL